MQRVRPCSEDGCGRRCRSEGDAWGEFPRTGRPSFPICDCTLFSIVVYNFHPLIRLRPVEYALDRVDKRVRLRDCVRFVRDGKGAMRYLLSVILFFWISGCTSPTNRPPDLIETQDCLVSGCTMLGMVTETADAGWISAHAARYRMLGKIRARAGQLGATHIVWLHKTDDSAAAKAYRCE